MQSYQREFIELAMEQNVLQFGEFELKSGRLSPYFFNSGLFRTGHSAAALARYYAAAAAGSGIEFDMLFGPAYKGIPLVALTAAGLADQGQDYPYCFNRKEAKDHGEGGNIVGGPIEGRILIVDDVITAGTAIRESVDIIRAAGAEPAGVLIALDRQERGQGTLSAVQEAEQELGLKVASIIGLNNLIEHLSGNPDTAGLVDRMETYRREYGITV